MFTQHPEVAVKARAEVLEHIGSNGMPDIHEIKKLKYCTIVFRGSNCSSSYGALSASGIQ